MRAFIDDYLQHLKLERGLSQNSLASYRRDLVEFSDRLGTAEIGEISLRTATEHVSYLTSAGRKPATIARKISSLKQFFAYLRDQGTISENPFLALLAPRISRYHPHYLSPEEIGKIIACVDVQSRLGKRDRAIVELQWR